MGWRDWFSFGRREGDGQEDEEEQAPSTPATDLIPYVEVASAGNGNGHTGGWASSPMGVAVAPSGIWVVVKFDADLEEGEWKEEFRAATIVKAIDGMSAIGQVYKRDLTGASESLSLATRDDNFSLKDAKEEDGRYVALDFYTGHRVEAKVTGEWNANVEVASGRKRG